MMHYYVLILHNSQELKAQAKGQNHSLRILPHCTTYIETITIAVAFSERSVQEPFHRTCDRNPRVFVQPCNYFSYTAKSVKPNVHGANMATAQLNRRIRVPYMDLTLSPRKIFCNIRPRGHTMHDGCFDRFSWNKRIKTHKECNSYFLYFLVNACY